jgi:hypothetical protein
VYIVFWLLLLLLLLARVCSDIRVQVKVKHPRMSLWCLNTSSTT